MKQLTLGYHLAQYVCHFDLPTIGFCPDSFLVELQVLGYMPMLKWFLRLDLIPQHLERTKIKLRIVVPEYLHRENLTIDIVGSSDLGPRALAKSSTKLILAYRRFRFTLRLLPAISHPLAHMTRPDVHMAL